MRSGNGWVTCEQGHQHWGLFGAAGLLAYAPDPKDPAQTLVLLQHRARWSHQGGTWALPGGAMDSEETPAEAALREADEECMLDPKLVLPRGMYTEEHGGWAYHTIMAQAAEPFRVYSDAYESDENLWLPIGHVDRRDLHPGFAACWPLLRAALLPLTVFVDGTGKPAAAAAALLARLAGLTRTGIASLPDGLAATALANWYPDYVLLLDDPPARAAGEPEPAAPKASYSWNEPLVVRTAEVRVVAAGDHGRPADALPELALSTPGRRLVLSDDPLARERAAAAGAVVAGLNWLPGELPPSAATQGLARGDTRPCQHAQRPLPDRSEPDTGAFWAASKEHRLTYQVCGACGEIIFHPRRHCTNCLSTELRWHDSVGGGTVYTYTVSHQHGLPFFRAKLPYVLGFIDLDEGFRLLAEIDAAPDAVQVGQRVTVAWEDHADLAVPVFRTA